MAKSITLDDVVSAAKGSVTADLGGEMVILDVDSGEYFGLNAVGGLVWELITEPRRVAEIRDRLLEEYPDVDSDQCTADLLALLQEMREASLVETAEASGH